MKTVLVTGGAKGIGKAICLEFANNNYNVVFFYNNSKSQANQLKCQIEKLGVKCECYKVDVTNANEIQQAFIDIEHKFKIIDVLVNNAGICHKELIIDESIESTKNIINTNLIGPIEVSKFALRNMIKQNSGSIVNISSIWGNCGASCEATYSASKAGIIAFTKSIAKEYSYSGITCNCVCPGVIDTEMNSNLTQEEKQELVADIPAGRFGETNEVAKLVLYLASDNSKYITGQIITIDGGFTL